MQRDDKKTQGIINKVISMSMTENEEIILKYLSFRGMALAIDIQAAFGRNKAYTNRVLQRLIQKGWVEKADFTVLRRQGFVSSFYQITQAGYLEANSDFGDDKFFKPVMPANFTHKTHIDHVTALLYRYGYRPYGMTKTEVQANLKTRGRVPDALMESGKQTLAIEVELATKNANRYHAILRSYVALISKGYIDGVCYVRSSQRSAEALKLSLVKRFKSIVIPHTSTLVKMEQMWGHFMFLGIDELEGQLQAAVKNSGAA